MSDQHDAAVARMGRILAAACRASGVADPRALSFDARRRSYALGDSRINVALETRKERTVWRVNHAYEVVDYGDPKVVEVPEVIGEFQIGDEPLAVRVAVMRAVEMVVDFAIDGAS